MSASQDELFTYEELQEFLGALLDVYGKQKSDPIFLAYWRCLQPIAPMASESVDVICGMISSPAEKMPSAMEIKAAIRQHRIDRTPAISAARKRELDGWQPYSIAQGRLFRLTVLSGIYRMQGDSKFYRALLKSKGGIYGQIASNVLQASGLTVADVAVTHEDVLLHLGVEIDEDAAAEPIEPVQSREIDESERDRLFGEMLAADLR